MIYLIAAADNGSSLSRDPRHESYVLHCTEGFHAYDFKYLSCMLYSSSQQPMTPLIIRAGWSSSFRTRATGWSTQTEHRSLAKTSTPSASPSSDMTESTGSKKSGMHYYCIMDGAAIDANIFDAGMGNNRPSAVVDLSQTL